MIRLTALVVGLGLLSGCLEIEEGYTVRGDGSVVIESQCAIAASAQSLPDEATRNAVVERAKARVNSPDYTQRATYREVSYDQRKVEPRTGLFRANGRAGEVFDYEVRMKVRMIYTHFMDLDPVGPVNLLVREDDPVVKDNMLTLPAPPRMKPIPSFPGTALIAVDFPSYVSKGKKPHDPLKKGVPLWGFKLAGPGTLRDGDVRAVSPSASTENGSEVTIYPDEFGAGFVTTRYFGVGGLYRTPEFLFCLVCTLVGLVSAARLIRPLLRQQPAVITSRAQTAPGA
ncbi:hypothetical protein GC173_08440 [bacterium]|nr:hypothetical protein [bacterium]